MDNSNSLLWGVGSSCLHNHRMIGRSRVRFLQPQILFYLEPAVQFLLGVAALRILIKAQAMLPKIIISAAASMTHRIDW